MNLEQWLSNSNLVRTNQLQNLFYKFNFTIFITAQRTRYGIQIPYRSTTSIQNNVCSVLNAIHSCRANKTFRKLSRPPLSGNDQSINPLDEGRASLRSSRKPPHRAMNGLHRYVSGSRKTVHFDQGNAKCCMVHLTGVEKPGALQMDLGTTIS